MNVSETTLEVDEGGSGTFDVTLAAAPTASVTVTVASDNTDVTVSPLTLLPFTATNYDTAQTVTVNMAASPTNGNATITLTAAGGNYAGLTATVAVSSNALPTFGNATIDDKDYTQDTAITTITLPAATGGDAPLTYALSPALPMGLAFDATTRTLSGTPTVPQAAAEYTYAVTDTDNDTAELTFDIRVAATLTIGDVADADQAENAAYTDTATLNGTPVGNVTWALEGADGSAFTLSNETNTGATVTLAAKDFESPADADTNNRYEYTLKATDDDGNTATKDVTIRITDVDEAPAKPSNVAVMAGATRDTEITLTWDDPLDSTITKYQVRHAAGTSVPASTPWTDITIVSGAATTSHTVKNLINFTEYAFQIRAVVGSAEGPASDTLTATPAIVPAPVITSITSGDAALVVNFTWSAPQGVAIDCHPEPSAFAFQYRKSGQPWPGGSFGDNNDNGGNFTFLDGNMSTRSYTIGRGVRGYEPSEIEASLTNGASYDVRMTANHRLVGVGCNNTSGWSNTSQGTPVHMAPDAPTNLKAVTGKNRVRLSWVLPTNTSVITKMQVRWTSDPAFDANDLWTDFAATATTYEATNLITDTAYTFAVRAVNTKGHGEATIQATPNLTPGPPVRLNATADDQKVTLSWMPPTTTLDFDGFQVRHKLGTAQDTGWSGWTDVTTGTTTTVENLTNEDAYDFEVRAFNVRTGGTKVEGPAAATNATPVVTLKKPVIYSVVGGDQALTFSWSDWPPSRTDCGVVGGPQPFFLFQYAKVGDSFRYAVTGNDENNSTNGRYFIYDDMSATSFTIGAQAEGEFAGEVGVNLENGVQYKVKMQIYSYTSALPVGCDWSLESSEANGTPTLPIPGTPPSLSATAGDKKVSLSWVVPTNASEIKKMQVRWKEMSSSSFNTWVDLNNSGPLYAPGTADTSFEVTGLTNGTDYTFEVRATNTAGNGAVATVTATPTLNAPTFGTATIADQDYTQDTAIPTLNLPQATGGDGTLSYTLTPTPPAGLTFDATARTLTGTPTVPQAAAEYTYTATDTGNDAVELKFNIRVAATLTVGGVADADQAENAAYSGAATLTGTPIGAVTWTLEGEDAADFTLTSPSNTGVTVGMVGRDFESPDDDNADNVYQYTLRATDDDGNTATTAVSITVTDVVETATLALTDLADGTVAENAPFTDTAALANAIGAVTWTLGGDDGALFMLTGQSATAATVNLAGQNFEAPADDGADNTYQYTLTATDADGNTVTSPAYTVTVTDVVETATLALTDLADGTVAENAPFTDTAALANAIGAVTWTLGGDDGALFMLTGQSATAATVNLAGQNFEAPADDGADNTYQYTLTATDADGNTVTSPAYTVTVTDVVETATLALTDLADGTVAENAPFTDTAALANAIGAVTWTLGGDDGALFMLTGQSATAATVNLAGQNFEAPADDGADNTYQYTLTATDADGNTVTSPAYTVTVTDVVETATLALTDLADGTVAENAPFTDTAALANAIGAVTWTLGGDDGALFMLTGQSATAATVNLAGQNFEAPADDGADNTYQYTLTATDADGNTVTSPAYTVTVTDVVETATLALTDLADGTVAENAPFTDTAALANAIGAVTWTLGGDDGALFMLTGQSATAATVNLAGQNFEAPADDGADNTYQYTLTATDADGNTVTSPAYTVTVTDVVETATLALTDLADGTVAENAPFTDTAALANAIGAVTWTLGGDDGALFMLTGQSATAATVNLAGQNFEAPADDGADNTYQYTLTATDADGNTVTSPAYTVTVTDVVETATLALTDLADGTVAENAPFTDTAALANAIGAVTWTLGGDDGALFMLTGQSATAATVNLAGQNFEAPADDGADNTYQYTLTATDADGNTVTSPAYTVTVTDVVETATLALTDLADGTVAENAPFTDTAALANAIGAVTWTLGGDDGALFMLTGQSATAATVNLAGQNFEAPADDGADNTYQYTLTATDADGNTVTSPAYTVTVTDVVETATLALTDLADGTVAENAPFTDTAALANAIGAVTWTLGGDDGALFMLTGQSATAATVNLAGQNFEAPADDGADNTYQYTLTATDADGNTVTSPAYTVTVTDVVETATLALTDLADGTVAENAPFTDTAALANAIGAVTWTLGGDDGALFMLTGQSATAATVNLAGQNFEAPADDGADNTYQYTLTATDADGNTVTSPAYTVTVTDVVETATLALTDLADGTVAENAPFTDTAALANAIGAVTWTLGGDDGALFMLTGQSATAATVNLAGQNFEAPADDGADNTYQYTLTATDADGNTVTSPAYTVTVTDVVETATLALTDLADGTVAENAPFTDTAALANAIGAVTWTLGGDDGALFMLTGQSATAATVNLAGQNFEAPADDGADNTYQYTLTATDADGNTVTSPAYTVTVTDVVETATLALTDLADGTVAENAPFTDTAALANAIGAVTWTLGGDDGALFMLTGQSATAATVNLAGQNFEAPADDGADNTYQYTLTATDADGNTVTSPAYTVTVTDVVETATLALTDLADGTVAENAPFTDTAALANAIGAVTWTLGGDDGALFMLTGQSATAATVNLAGQNFEAPADDGADNTYQYTLTATDADGNTVTSPAYTVTVTDVVETATLALTDLADGTVAENAPFTDTAALANAIGAVTWTLGGDDGALFMLTGQSATAATVNLAGQNFEAPADDGADNTYQYTLTATDADGNTVTSPAYTVTVTDVVETATLALTDLADGTVAENAPFTDTAALANAIGAVTWTLGGDDGALFMLTGQSATAATVNLAGQNFEAPADDGADNTYQYTLTATDADGNTVTSPAYTVTVTDVVETATLALTDLADGTVAENAPFTDTAALANAIGAVTWTLGGDDGALFMLTGQSATAATVNLAGQNFEAPADDGADNTYQYTLTATDADGNTVTSPAYTVTVTDVVETATLALTDLADGTVAENAPFTDTAALANAIGAVTWTLGGDDGALFMLTGQSATAATVNLAGQNFEAPADDGADNTYQYTLTATDADGNTVTSPAYTVTVTDVVETATLALTDLADGTVAENAPFTDTAALANAIGAVTWTLGGDDGALFMLTGQSATAATVNLAGQNFEAPADDGADNTYQYTLTATDADGNTVTSPAYTVTVTDVVETATLALTDLADGTVAENAPFTDTAALANAIGAVTWTLGGDDGALFMLTGQSATAATVNLAGQNFEAPADDGADNTYQYTLTATDADGNTVTSPAYTVTVTDVVETATLALTDLADGTVAENAPFTDTAALANAIGAVTWTLGGDDGALFMLTGQSATAATVNLAGQNFEAPADDGADNTYQYTLTATDADGNTVTSPAYTVTVTDVVETATLALTDLADGTVAENAPFTDTAALANAIGAVTWTLGGDDGALFMLTGQSATAATVNLAGQNFEAPADDGADNTYQYTLTATDADGNTVTSPAYTVTVTDVVETATLALTDLADGTVAENAPFTDTAALANAIGAVTWTLGGDDGALFMLTGQSATAATVNLAGQNFEAPADDGADNTYQYTLTATDADGNTVTSPAYTVTVTDVVETATLALTDLADGTVAENAPFTDTAALANAIGAVTWTLGGDDGALFMLTGQSATAATVNLAGQNFEAPADDGADNTYQYTLTATDADGNTVTSPAYTVTVTDVVETATLALTDLADGTVAENAPFTDTAALANAIGAVTWTLGGDDGALFMLTGQSATAATVNLAGQNFEAPADDGADNTYQYTLTATDADGNTVTSPAYTVTVTDVVETATLALTDLADGTVAENAPFTDTAALANAIGAVTWTLGGDDGALFMLTGQSATAATVNLAGQNFEAPADDGADNTYQYTLTATDADGNTVTSPAYTVTVTDVVETATLALTDLADGTVAENAPFTDTAALANAIGAVTWTLGGDDGALFMLTGQSATAATVNLAGQNFEAPADDGADNTYQYTLTATDADGNTVTSPAYTVTVTDVVETATLALTDLADGTVAENAPFTDTAALANAIGAVTWTLGGDDGALFMLTGQSATAATVNLAGQNFEAPADDGADNTYQYTLTATDADGNTVTSPAYTVTVTDVVETATLALTDLADGTVAENAPFTDTAALANAIGAVTWTLGGDDGALFMLTGQSATAATVNLAGQNFEAPADDGADNTYQYTLTATDADGNTVTSPAYTVTVTDVVETATLALTDLADGTVAENAPFTDTAALANAIGAVTWTLGGDDGALFMLTGQSATAATVNLAGQNFEAPADDGADNTYQYTLTATDADGNTVTSPAYTVTVTDVVETATLALTDLADGTVAENAPFTDTAALANAIGAVTWTLGGDDGALFMLTGQSATAATVNLAGQNFEAPADDGADNTYQYTLTATDADGNTVTSPAYTVTVTDVVETATLALTDLADGTVAENAPFTDTAALANAIGAVTWTLGGDDGALFMLTGQSATAATVNLAGQNFEAPADDGADNTYQYTLTATDADGNTVTSPAYTVTVTDVVETATLALTDLADGTVAENAPFTDTAALANAIGAVTWTLGGDDGALFMLTGQSATAATVNLAGQNFEAPADDGADNTYQYTLTATDADGNTVTSPAYTVTVTDVVETATLALTDLADGTVAENAPFTDTAALANAIGAVTWTLGGDDGALFMLTGQSATAATVNLAGQNFEAPADDGADNTYQYTLTATDADGNTVTSPAYTVTVTDVVETATLALTDLADGTVAENAPFTDTAALANAIGAVTWTLGGDDGALFMLTGQSATAATVNLAGQNFEAPADDGADNTYQYTLTATDADGNTVTSPAYTVTVTDVVETATLALTDLADGTVAENAPFTDTAALANAIGAVTWTLGGDDGALFMLTGQSATAATVNLAGQNFEAPADDGADNTYQYTLTATDADGNTVTSPAYTVTVTDVVETATLALTDLADGTVAENAPFTDTAALANAIGAVTWTLGGDDGALFMLTGQSATAATVNLAGQNFEAPADDGADNTYQYTLTATDADGNTVTSPAYTVTVTDVVETATLALTDLADGTVAENAPFTDTAALANAIGAVTWTLGGDDGALFMLTGQSATAATVNLAGQNFEAPADDGADNTYQYTLTATDADGNTVTSPAYTVTVTDVVETATLALTDLADGTVAENAPFTDTAALANAIGAVTWTLGGDDGALFMLTGQSATAATVNLAGQNFEAPADDGADNTYQYTLTATDADGNTVTSPAYTVTVTDVVETATLALTDLADGTVAENAPFTDTAALANAIGAVTWTLGGDDGALFMLTGQSATAATVNLAGQNFEAPADDGADNTYQYTLTATDADGNTVTSPAYTVTVTDVVETATLTVGGVADASQAENAAYSGAATLTGTPIGNVTWTLRGADAGRDAGDFKLTSPSNAGATVTMTAKDFESPSSADGDNVYEYTLTATDDDGNTATTAVSITVTDVVETTTLAVGGVADANQAENAAYSGAATLTGTPIGNVTWTLTGADTGDDAGDFKLSRSSNTGATVTMTAKDFESPSSADGDNVYEYTLTATDDDGNTASKAVSVTITDVQETTTLTISGVADANQAENAAYSGAATLTGTPIGNVTWTLTGADAGDDAGDFKLSSPSNAGATVTMTAKDFESPSSADGDNVYQYTLTATDDDGNTATKAVSVTITDVQETTTLTISGVGDANQAENAAYSGAATLTGTPIGNVTWTLRGADAGRDAGDFKLTSPSNAGATVTMTAKDFESPSSADGDNVYEYTLTATDDDGNTATTAVSITVTDVVETTTLAVGGVTDASQAENAAYSGAATLTGTPIGNVTWALEGDDAADFTLTSPSNTGVTVGMVGRDFESPDDDNADNVYEYTLRATDDDGNTATTAVSITITDDNTERATFTVVAADAQVQENTAYSGSATIGGADSPIGNVTWTLTGDDAGDDAGDFKLSSPSNTGATVTMTAKDFESPSSADGDNVYEYTLTATDADGNTASKSVSITITDDDTEPVILPPDLTPSFGTATIASQSYTQHTAIATLTLPRASSGDGTLTYTLSPAAPAGLTFDAGTRTLTGTPTQVQSATTYTYTATDTDGDTATLTFAITVEVSPVPSFGTETIAGQSYVQHKAIATLTLPQATGGDGTLTYTLSPATPAGLSFDASTRTLAGTPTQAQSATTYTYTATDTDGDTATLTFTITVEANLTPSFGNETIADQSYTRDTAIAALTLPRASNGDGTLTYALSPAAPAGLSFDASTRTLAGTPTQVQSAATYTYTATDADGDTASLTFSIMVEADLAPSFGDETIAGQSYTQHKAIATLTLPEASGGNGVLTYALSPAAPAGLTFDASTRTLSGTPTAAQSATNYTYTATDADGDTATLTFSITVEANLIPSFGMQAITDQSYAQDTAIATLTLPQATGGDGALTYTLSPAVPAGLAFDANTRTLTGTPTQTQSAATYTYTATDADGDSVSLTFAIAVETLLVPASPSGLVASTGSGQVSLSWADPGNGSILRYQVRFRAGASLGPSDDGLWQDIPGSGATTTAHTVSGLTNGTQYVFQVRAVNASGEGAASAQVTATPESTVPSEAERQAVQASLSGIAQASLFGARDMIAERVRARPGTSTLTLAGRQVTGAGWAESALDERVARLGEPTLGEYAQRIGDAELLRGSAFTLSLSDAEADGAPEWTMWGRGDVRRFSGRADGSDWDGSLGAGWLGVDVRASKRVFAGLALSQSRGEVDYRVVGAEDEELETSLTTVWPYLQMTMGDGGELQLLLGAGNGDAEHRSADGEVSEAALSMTAGSVGARWPVWSRGSVTLSAVTDAGVARLETDEASAPVLDGVKARAWRVRGGLEAAHAGMAITGSQWWLVPRGTVTVRRDGGDGVTGTGMELGGGIRFWGPAPRLSVDASGHWLGLHSEDGVREWGASIEARLIPGVGGRGLSWSLGPRWGVERTGVMEGEDVFHQTFGTGSQDSVFAARAGYGMGTAGGLMTPYAEMELGGGEDGVQRYGAGVELELLDGITATVRGEHREAADVDTRIGLDLRVRF